MKTSLCWCRAQEEELRSKLADIKRAVGLGRQLLLVLDKSKWDETKHTFTLSCDDDKLRKSWSVLRQRVWVGWWLVGEDGHNLYQQHYMELVLPPVIMIGQHTAGCLHDGLVKMPWHLALTDFLETLRPMARVSLSLRECDAAATNLKYLGWEQKQMPSNNIFSIVTCLLHGCQHIVKRVRNTLIDCEPGGGTIKSYGTLSALLRQGNYYLRCVLALNQVADKMLRVTCTPPSAEAKCQRRMLVDYFGRRHVRSKASNSGCRQRPFKVAMPSAEEEQSHILSSAASEFCVLIWVLTGLL